MITLCFTYNKVDEESAKIGDFCDHGFYHKNGWEFSMNNPETEKDILENPQDYRENWEYR